ncbi:GL20562 [Drosophila persimilis]|uniref:GL20562 n=1 Tax=Drosophila persimilis TaxID=7234 RepID=B4GPJ8_DROPE|nr:GL20562 [Drosophila persimilis]
MFTSFPDLQSHEIQNLQTYTQYKVTVQVFNPEGLGPETTILVMTDEGGECHIPPQTLSMMNAAHSMALATSQYISRPNYFTEYFAHI